MEMAAKRSQVVQSGRYFRNLVACRDKECVLSMDLRKAIGREVCVLPLQLPSSAQKVTKEIFHNVSRYSHDKLTPA